MSPSAGTVVDKELLESALRFDLRPGNWVLWEGRPCKLESLRGTQARILETHSRQLREVQVGDLRAMPSLPAPELDDRLERQRTADKPSWALAEHREAVLRELMAGDGPATARTRAAAQALHRSVRTVQRLIARYKSSAQATSLSRIDPDLVKRGAGWAPSASG